MQVCVCVCTCMMHVCPLVCSYMWRNDVTYMNTQRNTHTQTQKKPRHKSVSIKNKSIKPKVANNLSSSGNHTLGIVRGMALKKQMPKGNCSWNDLLRDQRNAGHYIGRKYIICRSRVGMKIVLIIFLSTRQKLKSSGKLEPQLRKCHTDWTVGKPMGAFS